MSRIGKLPITLPEKVNIVVGNNNMVTVKGPKGELIQKVDPDIIIKTDNKTVTVERPTEQKRHKAMHGLYRSLISNMVVGVSEGFQKKLELSGVGYRVNAQGQNLELSLGFSHNIIFVVPNEVKINVIIEKRQNPIITLESIDKQLLGQVAAKIRSLRKPEPYKGKGIKYINEIVRRKAGKAAAAAK